MRSWPEDPPEAPADLLGSEQYELYNCANLDDFFTRLYRHAAHVELIGQPDIACWSMDIKHSLACASGSRICG